MTDHNEISGALEARAKADGIKVIVGEEVKTADQGEVIGLFIEEKIPRGLTLQETIAEIKRQGGLVYVPHPFDRMHAVPDYEHLLTILDDVDAIEVFNPRVAIGAFNEEAVRFAAKYRIAGRRRLGRARARRGSARCASACATSTGRRSSCESLRDAEIVTQAGLAALRAGAEVPADARPRRDGARASARARRSGAPPCTSDAPQRKSLMQRAGNEHDARVDNQARRPSVPMPATDDEIREKYLERAIRELNTLTRELQACPHCPRGNLMPVLGSGPPAGRRLPAQVRAAARRRSRRASPSTAAPAAR